MAPDPQPQGSATKASPSAASAPLMPPKIILEQPRSRLGRYGKLLLIALLISLLVNFGQYTSYKSYFTSSQTIQEKFHSGNEVAKDKVAIISLKGTILEGDGFVKRQIDQVKKDESVKAIVLRIDSPGGTVTGSDFLYHHMKQLVDDKERKIPLVVSMGGLCASGGYYVAMAVGDQKDSLYAEPSTWTGSIGVIIPHYDISGLMEKWAIKDDSIKSHRYKQLLSPTHGVSKKDNPEGYAILEGLVEDSFEGFKDKVRAGRPMFRDNDAALDMVATGQIFTAHQALQNGLVDKIGFLEEAIDRAIELAGLPKADVRVVKYTRPPTVLETLTSGSVELEAPGSIDLAALLEMTAPRAYYLCTWLPAVASTR